MADSRDDKRKPGPRWPVDEPAATPASKDAPPQPERSAGRIVHDARGNAVWNWLKETGRFCIDSTSAMLKRLEVADLKVEGQKDEVLRMEEPSRDSGGGYDPYNQPVHKPIKKPAPKGRK